jgi:hypothetical protein
MSPFDDVGSKIELIRNAFAKQREEQRMTEDQQGKKAAESLSDGQLTVSVTGETDQQQEDTAFNNFDNFQNFNSFNDFHNFQDFKNFANWNDIPFNNFHNFQNVNLS